LGEEYIKKADAYRELGKAQGSNKEVLKNENTAKAGVVAQRPLPPKPDKAKETSQFIPVNPSAESAAATSVSNAIRGLGPVMTADRTNPAYQRQFGPLNEAGREDVIRRQLNNHFNPDVFIPAAIEHGVEQILAEIDAENISPEKKKIAKQSALTSNGCQLDARGQVNMVKPVASITKTVQYYDPEKPHIANYVSQYLRYLQKFPTDSSRRKERFDELLRAGWMGDTASYKSMKDIGNANPAPTYIINEQ
jgi:hypothetical protein